MNIQKAKQYLEENYLDESFDEVAQNGFAYTTANFDDFEIEVFFSFDGTLLNVDAKYANSSDGLDDLTLDQELTIVEHLDPIAGLEAVFIRRSLDLDAIEVEQIDKVFDELTDSVANIWESTQEG